MKKSNKLINYNGEEIKLDIGSISYEDLLGSERPLEWGIIVEKGNNSNGEYVKYGNGLMLCFLRIVKNDIAFSSAYGPGYIGSYRWTFPKSFIDSPRVVCTEFKYGTGIGWGSVFGSSETYSDLRGLDFYERAMGQNVRISALAIGHWK